MGKEVSLDSTRIWFGSAVRDGASELFVQTPDRLGILFAVVTAIIGARVKILKSEATIADGVARDWFLVAEPDGNPLGPVRREHLRTQVLAAILSSWQRDVAA
jgi:UTP:GlnB (protein PII) uridylyltransferase